MKKYFDKNGDEIKVGNKIQHDNGEIEQIFACGDNDLGVNASRENSPCFDGIGQCYPLSEFDLSEWKIIK